MNNIKNLPGWGSTVTLTNLEKQIERLSEEDKNNLILEMAKTNQEFRNKAQDSGLAMQEINEMIQQAKGVGQDVNIKARGNIKTGSGQWDVSISKKKFF